jgi:hypothetical protein
MVSSAKTVVILRLALRGMTVKAAFRKPPATTSSTGRVEGGHHQAQHFEARRVDPMRLPQSPQGFGVKNGPYQYQARHVPWRLELHYRGRSLTGISVRRRTTSPKPSNDDVSVRCCAKVTPVRSRCATR